MVQYNVVRTDLVSALAVGREDPEGLFSSIADAVSHLNSPSDFVVAVENGMPRQLNPQEEAEYQRLRLQP